MDITYLTSAILLDKEDQTLIIPQIKQIYKKLHVAIEGIEQKVGHTIQKNQSQFLFAYRNHIKKIKKQLFQIKQKSEEQQKMFSANDRIKYLQKQLTIFRQEAAKTYQKLEKKVHETQQFRKKYEETLKMYLTMQITNKELIKQNKIMEMKKGTLEEKLKAITAQLQEKNTQVIKIKDQQTLKTSKNNDSIQDKWNLNSLRSSKMEYPKQKKISRYNNNNEWNSESQFKEYFFNCMKTIKKQISYRKGSFSNDFGMINSLQQFRAIDKWRIIQLFLQNPKLQQWMYDKLFPSPFIKKINQSSNLYHQKNINLPKVRERTKSHLETHSNKTFL